ADGHRDARIAPTTSRAASALEVVPSDRISSEAMAIGRRAGLYWACWLLAVLFTALVAGLMLGHALILAPFLSWMLATGPPGTMDHTYPVFRATAGAVGLTVYYLV